MSRSTVTRRLAGIALAATAATGLTLATAGTASAATHKNGVVESGEFGLYYNSDFGGCVFDLYVADSNFYDDKFIGSCAGSGQSTNDNTASYWNRDVNTWYVYTDANRGGVRGSLPSGYSGNASATFKNEISSAYYTL
ncbi:peptidase inhibitor family I36 protein [Streptomyces sp. ISL-100]|uniref:peptidase inhibitor family I36 protein n=1 Tax=Streptomyces sp. ISL-100 TaxID=2819173 RepID=UPI001BE6EC8D|nr:peptidase inhibitor family I36 protein [Streptomyces sp. ISL-100]MBT2397063.1 peptidase inhibitor family I36 protein [Streptomyces sp. ISL-100]